MKRNKILAIVMIVIVGVAAFFIFSYEKKDVIEQIDYTYYYDAKRVLLTSDYKDKFDYCDAEAFCNYKDDKNQIVVVIGNKKADIKDLDILVLDSNAITLDKKYPSLGLIDNNSNNLDKSIVLGYEASYSVDYVYVYMAYSLNNERLVECVRLAIE